MTMPIQSAQATVNLCMVVASIVPCASMIPRTIILVPLASEAAYLTSLTLQSTPKVVFQTVGTMGHFISLMHLT